MIDAQILDSLLSKDKGVISKHSHVSIIQYFKQDEGTSIVYNSKPIPLSKLEIIERMRRQEGVFLYYKESDPSSYQFDLEFLF